MAVLNLYLRCAFAPCSNALFLQLWLPLLITDTPLHLQRALQLLLLSSSQPLVAVVWPWNSVRKALQGARGGKERDEAAL